MKHGLEILGIAVIDADIRDAMMLRAVQTLNSTELEGKKFTLNQWYLSVLKTYRTDLLKITSLLVADAAFSVLPFVEGLKEIGFSLISRLRSNAVCITSTKVRVPVKEVAPRPRTARSTSPILTKTG